MSSIFPSKTGARFPSENGAWKIPTQDWFLQSNNGMERLLVDVQNLSLILQVPHFRNASLRDRFVNWAHSRGDKTLRKKTMTILDNISFQIATGDRIGVLGTNGQGKTSLCRCLAGYYNPSRGFVRRYGKVRGIFDTSTAIYPELTGRENARLLLHYLYPEIVLLHSTGCGHSRWPVIASFHCVC